MPTTFGAKAATWLTGLLDAREDLDALEFPAQLGGAVGTLAPLGDAGPEVVRLYAEELGLSVRPVWHTIRTPVARVGAALDLTAGVAAKIALDVVLLAQTEVGEVREGAGGPSSTMPHKRNPKDSTLAIACARVAHGHAATLTGSLAQEHERAAGAWHAEWPSLTGALTYAGGAVAAVARALDGLEVDVDAMRRNLELTQGAVFAEHAIVPARRASRATGGTRARRTGDRERTPAARGARSARWGVRRRGCGRDRGRRRRPGARALRSGPLKLRHRLEGPDGAPVLLLANSLGTTLELWDQNVDAWTPNVRVLRYDARGHGGSDVPPGPYSLELLGRDALGLLDELGIERASFCGVSLGGATGLWLAANAPERIDRLVVACSSARFGEPTGWHERAELARTEGMEAIADAVVSRWFTPDAPRELVAAHRADARLDRRPTATPRRARPWRRGTSATASERSARTRS